MTFDEAAAFALTLPGTEASTSYRQPCVRANGNGFLFVGHEPDEAFALHVEPDTRQMLFATHPETFFETPHYVGTAIALVRYSSTEDDLVRDLIARAASQAGSRPPPRTRSRSTRKT